MDVRRNLTGKNSLICSLSLSLSYLVYFFVYSSPFRPYVHIDVTHSLLFYKQQIILLGQMTTAHNNNINEKAPFIRAVEEAFYLLDRDQNRSIGPEDFCAVAKSIGINLDLNEAMTLLRTALSEQTDDAIHETVLTVDQYATLMLRHVGSSELNDELRRTFDALDRDHDGIITPQDFNRLRYESDFFDKLDNDQYNLMIKEILLLGNNGINFDQFVQLMMH